MLYEEEPHPLPNVGFLAASVLDDDAVLRVLKGDFGVNPCSPRTPASG